MTPKDGVLAVLETVEASGVPYVIVGALAYGAWGIPRSTKDADFVVACAGQELDAVLRKLPSSFSIDPQARMELFTGTLRWILHLEGTPFEIEVFLLGNDPHHAEIFARKRREHILMIDRDAWIPAPEDLVIQKLRWARRKDLDDAQNILAVQGDAIDYAHIELWCGRHGTLERLAEVRAGIPPAIFDRIEGRHIARHDASEPLQTAPMSSPNPPDFTPESGGPTDVAPLGRGGPKPEHEKTAGEDGDLYDWDAIANHPDFAALKRAKLRFFIIPGTIFFLVYYMTLPVLIGFFPEIMKTPVWGKVNWAYLFALSQFIMTWVVCAMYVRVARRWDIMNTELLSKFPRR